MNNVDCANRIKHLCKSRNITVVSVLNACKIRKNLIYDMEKRNKTPSAEILEQIADYLGCSVDYLLGRNVEECEKSPGTEDSMPRDEEERELIRLARKAGPAQKAVALQVLKLAVENERSASRKS